MSVRVGVVGATGYVGAELIRLLLDHPGVALEAVCSRSRAGTPLATVAPGLLGIADLVLEPVDPERLSGLDAVVLALPHGASASLATQLTAPLVLDMGRDHRHADGWVYGLAEWAAEDLAGASRIAVPGCFATAISLSLAPLAVAGLLRGPVHVAAATGSTGSGASAKQATHHPERIVNLKAYKVLAHQHVPEIRALLASLGADVPIRFVPLSAPVDRGIFATTFVEVAGDVDVHAVFADAYAACPMVRLRPDTPELRFVRGTGFCDLSVHRDGDTTVVLAALDNLGKGAAAQGVQCLNLALGLGGATSLLRAPLTP